jgi:hypothetical protein
MTPRGVLLFAIGWGAASTFWLLLWGWSEWTDRDDFLECVFMFVQLGLLSVLSAWPQRPLKPTRDRERYVTSGGAKLGGS